VNIQKTNIQTELLKEIFQDAKLVKNFDNALNVDHKIRKQELRSYILDNDAKAKTLKWKQENMNKVYWLCKAFLLCVFVIIILDGFSKFDGFSLPIEVIIAIISGFVIHGLGLYAIVLYNLFPQRKKTRY